MARRKRPMGQVAGVGSTCGATGAAVATGGTSSGVALISGSVAEISASRCATSRARWKR